MMINFNNLSPSEDERLTLLIEECSEVIKNACKIQRHGYSSVDPETLLSNRDLLKQEIIDVLTIIDLLISSNDITLESLEEAKAEKRIRMKRYLHHHD